MSDNVVLWIVATFLAAFGGAAAWFIVPPIVRVLKRFALRLKNSAPVKTRSFIRWLDYKWYSWFYCFPLLHKAIQRSKVDTRQGIYLHISEMINDAKYQRYGSFVELEDDAKKEEITREIETVAIGRIEALKDVISYLHPKLFPPDHWDKRSNNTTSPGVTIIVGSAIGWRLHDNDDHTPKRWIYVERKDKKWGRRHRYYFRPNLERRDGTL